MQLPQKASEELQKYYKVSEISPDEEKIKDDKISEEEKKLYEYNINEQKQIRDYVLLNKEFYDVLNKFIDHVSFIRNSIFSI